MLTVRDVINEIEKTVKPEYAYEWDNCGLVCGGKNRTVTKMLITLDVTLDVIHEAAEKGCDMIVSHHPLIFRAIKKASTDTYEGSVLELLYKNGISLYCAHTSLDIARGGVNDSLCECLGLENVRLLGEFEINGEKVACARFGTLKKEMTGAEFIGLVKNATGATDIRSGGMKNKTVKTVALSTGAGEEFIFESDADVFLTGEMKYHTALEAKRQNKAFVIAGHYYTEHCMMHSLARSLQNSKNMIECKIIESEVITDPFDN